MWVNFVTSDSDGVLFLLTHLLKLSHCVLDIASKLKAFLRVDSVAEGSPSSRAVSMISEFNLI